MNKHFFKQTIVLIFAVLGLSSCHDEDKVEMSYTVFCSEDLLRFVSPVVTYVNGDGIEESTTLTTSNWNKSGSVSTGDESSSTTITGLKSYTWTQKVVFDSFGVSGKITVKYTPLSDYEDTTEKQYNFNHQVFITAKAENDDIQNQYTNISVDLTGTKIDGENVSTYISNLALSPDTKTCNVDGDGNITIR